MFGSANLDAEGRLAKHTPSANNPAVVTLTPSVAEESFVIDWILWSYDATPTGGRLTITIDGTVVVDVDITTGGPGPVGWGRGIAGGPNQTVVITLAAGGGSVVGKLNVGYH